MRHKAAIFTSAFLIGLSGAMMPGPLLTACIGYTLEDGFWAGGPLLVLGHALLEGALVVGVLAGLGPVLARRKVGAAIGLVGGAVLVWMGVGMIARAAAGGGLPEQGAAGVVPPLHPVLAGALISLANPYWTLWWATVGLKYVALSRQAGRGGLVAFFGGHELSDAGWYFLVAGATALGQALMSAAVYRWIIGLCGAVLLAFGAGFLLTGARVLLPARRATATFSRAPRQNLRSGDASP